MSKLSIEWYEKAAEKGHPEALRTLGDLYFNGTEVDKDYSKAKSYYEEAIKRGCKNQEAVKRNLEIIDLASAPKEVHNPVKIVKKRSNATAIFFAFFAAAIVVALAIFVFFKPRSTQNIIRVQDKHNVKWVQDKRWYSERCSKLAADVKDIIAKPYSYDKNLSDKVLNEAEDIKSKLKSEDVKEGDIKTLLQQLENDFSQFKLSCVWQSGKPNSKYKHVFSSRTEGQWEPESGYAFLYPGSYDLSVRWKAGLPHPYYDHVVSAENEGAWRPEYGYEYVNPGSKDLTVRWKPGMEHPVYDNAISSRTEGVWIPETGYEFVNPGTGDLTVKWKSGIDHPRFANVVSSIAKGVWIPKDGYEFVLPGSDDLSVRWKAGTEHSKYSHVISSKTEGVWVPESGYEFVNPGGNDLTVKEVPKWVHTKEWYDNQARSIGQEVLIYKRGTYYYDNNLMNKTVNGVNSLRDALKNNDPAKAESIWRELNDNFTKFKNSCGWKSGVEHPKYPHVVSGTQPNTWTPEKGWEFVNPGTGDYTVKKKSITCRRCSGTGKISCASCGGAGKLLQNATCSNCDGTGEVTNLAEEAVKWTGRILRAVETKGRDLGSSSGSVSKERCSECRGTGQVRKYIDCHTCNGTGKVTCSQCSGKGTVYEQ